ncbi:MAG: hypothetical protein IT364_03055 [Candidatus Hydrogenedentes bacterium]|nr:hypothetical protein [Candidatus Hydrogenedentota bacterium]
MNDRRLNEELSAYLDGEARDADGVARILKSDPQAARRYEELARLSSHLKSLPGPEVHPAFATRVLASAREQSLKGRTNRLRYWLPASALAALTLAAVAAAVLRGGPEPAVDPSVAAVLELRHGNEAELGPFATLMDQDILAPLETSAAEPIAAPDSSAVDTMEMALASMVWFESEDTARNETQDVDSMLESLNDAEITVLRELLVEYAAQGDTI